MSAPPRHAASRPVSDCFNDGRRGFQRPRTPLTDKHTFHNSTIEQLVHRLAYNTQPVLASCAPAYSIPTTLYYFVPAVSYRANGSLHPTPPAHSRSRRSPE